jgi:hypothetical protein
VSELWSLPGYEVRSLVGDGRAGDLWSAVELATGEPVALRRVGGAADRAGCARWSAVHADLPYVVRLRDVVEHEGLLVLVLDAPRAVRSTRSAPGGARSTRGRWSPSASRSPRRWRPPTTGGSCTAR